MLPDDNRTIKNTRNGSASQSGLTLVEVMVGMAIFSVCIVSLMAWFSQIANSGKQHDYQAAYTILSGDIEMMYKYNVLPEADRTVAINGKKFHVTCITSTGSIPLQWRLQVSKYQKVIYAIEGVINSSGLRRL